MSLSGYQIINGTVRYGADGFDFAGTLGDFIGNSEYSYGNDEYKNDVVKAKEGQPVFPTSRSNIWHAMSAIGQDIGEVTYANVRNYIDIVSNIDMCKTRSLMSMMKNLGMDYSVIDDVNDFPIEVLNLIDIFSIDKKYLLDNDKIKADLVEDIREYAVNNAVVSSEDYYRCFSNGFELSMLNPTGKSRLVLELDNGYGSEDFVDSIRSQNDLVRSKLYDDRLSAAVYRKYLMLSGGGDVSCDIYKLGRLHERDGEYWLDDYYAVVSGDQKEIVCSASAKDFEGSVIPGGFYVSPFPTRADVAVRYASGANGDGKEFDIGNDHIDEQKYFEYVKSVFKELLSSYLELTYNVVSGDIEYLYPIFYYIQNEYEQNKQYYKDRENLTSDALRFKRVNNIPLGFDEQRVVDDIDAGRDSLDAYDGSVRELLDMEISRRARRLMYSDTQNSKVQPAVDKNSYSYTSVSADNFADTAKNITRYSYYRKAKVLEYARFVDGIFALGDLADADSVEQSQSYRFDENSYMISGIGTAGIFNYSSTYPSINQEELESVSENLANLTQYIARLRGKVKLQVRKNYMKGTNNLLTYLINEFLVDYSRTNRIFKESLSCPLIQTIYGNLSSSDLDDIEVVEYRDDTEYYNLSSARSFEALTQEYNNDFKSAYFKKVGGTLSAFDGKTFTFDQIKEFYLSSLGLKNSLSDTTDGFIRFMTSIFEIGQQDSFMDERGNFACKLDDGRYTTELWDELDSISGYYTQYKNYLSAGDHEYPADTVQNQLTDMVENYMGGRLSDEYLAGVSDVYDQYHEDIEKISAAVLDISSQYVELIEGDEYALYLDKSKCKYCYTDGEEDLVSYRHDWYNGNANVYNSQYLIDKIGDLKRFISDARNVRCYPVLDTLDYVRGGFSRISSELMANAENPAEGYGYVDIMSPFLDEEMRSIYAYLESESNLRKGSLQSMLANIRQQAQQAKDTYDKLDNSFAAAMANYDTGDGAAIGVINTNIFGQCNDTANCTLEKWFKSNSTYEAYYKKYKDKDDRDIVRGILIRDKDSSSEKKNAAKYNVAFYRYYNEDKNKNAKYDKFTVNEDLFNGEQFDGNCAIDDSMPLTEKIERVLAWMNQVTNGRVEAAGTADDGEGGGEGGGDCWIADPTYEYMNAGVHTAIMSIKGDLKELEETVEKIEEQIASIGGSFSGSGDIKDHIDELQKYLGTEIDENFTDDPKLKAYGDLRKVISQLSAQFDNLKLVYDAMPQDDEYADYIMEAYKSDFTLENIDSLSAYVVEKGVQDKIALTSAVKQLIDEYNMQQNVYTAIAEQIDALLTDVGMLEPDPYLELLVEYMHNKLFADIGNKIRAAQERIDQVKREVRSTINPLSTRISSQMSAYEHDFEYYFDQYLSTLNYFQMPEYLSAYELFKVYGGTDECYDPYYNYKNTTHPSFQVHPFLWNFVEATGVREIVSRSFDGLLNEKLERLQVHKYIDGMIGEFGQIVNIWQNNTTDCTGYTTRYEINTHTDEGVDYSPVVDYDGGFYPPAVKDYLADREVAVRSVADAATAKSIAQDVRKALATKVLSVMDADQIYAATSDRVEPYYSNSGYKNIINKFIQRYTVETSAGYILKGSKDNLRDMVQEELSGTFFENYYGHLHIDKDSQQLKFIADQLSCDDIYMRIKAIAEDKDQISDVYDIYKYGLDYQKNMYVLYKKYREPNPTYKERRNTPGALWIRLKHHPIAFPALLSGGNISCQAIDAAENSRLNNYLSCVCFGSVKNKDGRPVDFIDIDRYCYDFDFSYDREAIAMPCVNRDAVDPIFRTCDYPEVVMSIIENKSISILTKRRMLCFSNNEGEADDVVSVPEWVPVASTIMGGTTMTCPAYLGAYSPSLKNIRLVYAYKDHSRYSDEIDDLMRVSLHSGPDGDVQLMFALYNENTTNIGKGGSACTPGFLTGISPYFDVTSHEIAFTCEDLDYEKLTFAFPVERNTTSFKTYNGIEIDVDPNTDGGCLDDPSADEITSHDIFDEHIAIVHAHFNGGLYQNGRPVLYNLNADISYQPVYPGYSHRYDSPRLTGYENIELLGKSKDISKSIAEVNPDADPYFQLSDLLENGAYGRVYEDYTQEVEQDILNKTFVIATSPAFGENKRDQQWRPTGGAVDKHYTWYIDLPSAPSSDVMRMNFVMFNTRNMGKNPYFIGKMAQFSDYTVDTGAWLPAYYNAEDSERECVISSIGSDGSDDVTGKYSITGINRQGYTNAMDNNRVGNISGIRMQLDFNQNRLVVRFDYADTAKEAHIDEGLIRCVFYDDKNIKQFEHYHMLDAYGAINAYELLKNRGAIDQVIRGDGWKIIYDTQYDEKFKDKIKSFIFDNGQRLYLEDIDLSRYSFLSNIYVYRENKLAFKYNEEDMFEYTHSEYHYPFLNRKYPNTVAQYYATHMNFNVDDQSSADDQLNIFDESNLFILNYAEAEHILSAIGRIAIPVYDVDEEDVYIRAFEDYLDVYDEPGLDAGSRISGYNSDKYAEDDPRILQFAHFVTKQKQNWPLPDASANAGGLEVPPESYEYKTVDEFSDYAYSELPGYQYRIRQNEAQTQDSAVKYVYVTPTADNCDISELLDIQVNYRRDPDKGLTLFFNYVNYMNTPFVKYVDGKFMIDTIDRTYLMLKPGESGELDIVLQVRYYIGNKLYGYRNVKALTFKIHNLSDDKPKFYITKTYELRPNSLDFEYTGSSARLGVVSAEIDLEKYSPEMLAFPVSCDVEFTIDSDWRIRPGSTVEIAYPAHMIRPIIDAGYNGYVVSVQQEGVMQVKLNDPDMTQFVVGFQTARAGIMMAEYANRRYAFIYGKADIFDFKGRKVDVTSRPGAFMIKNSNTYILVDEDNYKAVAAGLGRDEYSGIYMHSF